MNSRDERSRRQLLAGTGGAVAVAGLAGCLGGRSDDDPDDSETDAPDCDQEPAQITNPDGDAMVSVSTRESIADATPDSGVTLAVSRIEFDGADVPTVVYETDATVQLWADGDDSSDESTILEAKPIPVGTYSGIRVYGTASTGESEGTTVPLADGDYVEDVFGTVFEADDRTEFVFQTVHTDDEIDFAGRVTTGW